MMSMLSQRLTNCCTPYDQPKMTSESRSDIRGLGNNASLLFACLWCGIQWLIYASLSYPVNAFLTDVIVTISMIDM